MLWALAALAVLAVILILRGGRDERIELDARLERRGWLLYVRDGCGYCTKQLAMLGPGFRRHNVVECNGPPPNAPAAHPASLVPSCQDPRISGFPFWYNKKTGLMKTGLQSHHELERMAQK
jgi:hypothetical protein